MIGLAGHALSLVRSNFSVIIHIEGTNRGEKKKVYMPALFEGVLVTLLEPNPVAGLTPPPPPQRES